MQAEIAVLGGSWPEEILRAPGEQFTCHAPGPMTDAQRAAFMKAAAPRVRGVLASRTIGIDAAPAALFPSLQIASVHGAGLGAVALAYLSKRGVIVTNTPDVLTDDAAGLAVGLLLAAARSLPALDRYVRAGHRPEKRPLQPARSLRGKIAGVYGYGRIGQAVASRLRAFGMDIRYFQRSEGPDPALRSPSLLALAADSDFLVRTPGGAATRHAVDAAVLAEPGPGGTLVNTARGTVVGEAALVRALAAKALGAAAPDVFYGEPRAPAALFDFDNVVLTPHVGSFTVEAGRAMGELALGNLVAQSAGRPALTPAGS